MSRCWLVVVSEENWYTVKNMNIYGAPEAKGFRPAYELIQLNDVLVFYVKKKESRELGGKIVGVFRAISTWFREDRPLWPDEIREGRILYPWRIRLEPVKLGVADFNELAPRLKFIERKDRPNAYLVGTPANLRRPIPEEDVKLIIENLR